jgi:hypothetical protein
VRDEHHRAAVGGERAEHAPQLAHLGRRQHGGGLVEHEHARAAVEHLEDLDALRLADAQVGHAPRRVDAEPRALGERAHLGLGAAPVERQPAGAARALHAQHHVLRDRERRDEHEVLVHHADPRGDRLRRRPPGDVAEPAGARVGHLDRAGVGRVHAAQHAHERALAGAVLADERVHLAARRLERRVAVGDHRAERLRHAAHAHRRRARARRGVGPRSRHRVLGTRMCPAMIESRRSSTRARAASGMRALLRASYT